jgi:nucleotide-binding universal stress UspA family protein
MDAASNISAVADGGKGLSQSAEAGSAKQGQTSSLNSNTVPGEGPTRLLVATDLSDTSSVVVSYAAGLAARLGSTVTLAHAIQIAAYPADRFGLPDVVEVSENEVRERLNCQAVELREEGLVVNITYRHGPAAEAVIAMRNEVGADLIVVGTKRGSGFMRLLLGSVADEIVRMSTWPVLVVPSHPMNEPARIGAGRRGPRGATPE